MVELCSSKPAPLQKPSSVSQGKKGCGTPASFKRASSKLRCRAEGLSAGRGANGKLGDKSAERKVHQRRSFMSRLSFAGSGQEAATYKNRPSCLRASRDGAPGEFQASSKQTSVRRGRIIQPLRAQLRSILASCKLQNRCEASVLARDENFAHVERSIPRKAHIELHFAELLGKGDRHVVYGYVLGARGAAAE
jgi:hypothetical protein